LPSKADEFQLSWFGVRVFFPCAYGTLVHGTLFRIIHVQPPRTVPLSATKGTPLYAMYPQC